MLNLRKFLLLLSFVYAHKDLSLELRLGLATALEDGGLIRPVGPTAWPPTVCDMECFAAGVSAYFSVAGVCFKKYNGDVVKAMECIEVKIWRRKRSVPDPCLLQIFVDVMVRYLFRVMSVFKTGRRP